MYDEKVIAEAVKKYPNRLIGAGSYDPFCAKAEDVKRRLRAKEVDCDAAVDHILELDGARRDLIFKTETAKSEQNKSSKEIPALKKAGADTSWFIWRL